MKDTITALFSFRPTPRLLRAVGAAAVAGLSIGVLRIWLESPSHALLSQLSGLWFLLLVALTTFALYDLLNGLPSEQLTVQRTLPNSFGLNRPQIIKFELINDSQANLDVELYDAVPNHFVSSDFPLQQVIDSNQKGVFEYSVIPKSRGLAEFEPAFVLIRSRYGLWQFIKRLGPPEAVKVYPDFSAISDSFIFGVEQTMRNMGAHIAKRKGDGMEFNQLREFREGDTLKQIDWKATARLGDPISREYQEEKDQNIVFLLDCSRRMRAVENNLSYFDFALNALLMTSYIALDKGDAVGVMTFSGEPSWQAPIKGKIAINTILNHLYALKTSTQSSDYVVAAENLLLKQRKRSLIILMTNVRDEDNEDLEKAVEILSQQHLVMVVALQERLLEGVNDMNVGSPSEALLYAGVKHFEHSRRKMLNRLKAGGVSVVDATHQNIHTQLVTEYLRLKQSGRI